jgi:hypothetical protein
MFYRVIQHVSKYFNFAINGKHPHHPYIKNHCSRRLKILYHVDTADGVGFHELLNSLDRDLL